jgi:aminoglycoside 6'-N-acetyltransferase
VISFAPLREPDLDQLHAWLGRPHMTGWTHGEVHSLDHVRAEYADHVMDPPTCFIIELAGRRVGYIQFYAVAESMPSGIADTSHRLFAAYPLAELAGVDLFLGEPDVLGQGPRILDAFLAEHIWPRFRVAVVDPWSHNPRALRGFAKAGFQPTDFSDDPAYVVMIRERSPD